MAQSPSRPFLGLLYRSLSQFISQGIASFRGCLRFKPHFGIFWPSSFGNVDAGRIVKNFLKTPFVLGGLSLPNNIFYAPLAGCSDVPYRAMAQKFAKPGLHFCEMVKIDALVRHDPHTYRLLDFTPDMHPIGAQICGSKPKMAAQAAKIVEDLGFDVIDLNCGCPVDKVTKDGSGSGLLKNPHLIGEIISEIVAVVKVPVTIKIRIGWDEKSIMASQITQIAEKAGAKAITIHGRTREQGYKGPAIWGPIQECKAVADKILVIGNGDVFDPESALRMFETTQCDGLLIARGGMGQPWLGADILQFLSQDAVPLRTIADVKQALFDHFEMILRYQNERQALLDFRRVGCWYLKRCENVKQLRMELNRSTTTQEALNLVHQFSWEQVGLNSASTLEIL